MQFNCGLEHVVVGNHDPVGIGSCCDEGLWHRITRLPELHRPVINCIGTAQHFGAQIARVPVSSNFPQIDPATGLIITRQHVLHGEGRCCCGCAVAAFKHCQRSNQKWLGVVHR